VHARNARNDYLECCTIKASRSLLEVSVVRKGDFTLKVTPASLVPLIRNDDELTMVLRSQRNGIQAEARQERDERIARRRSFNRQVRLGRRWAMVQEGQRRRTEGRNTVRRRWLLLRHAARQGTRRLRGSRTTGKARCTACVTDVILCSFATMSDLRSRRSRHRRRRGMGEQSRLANLALCRIDERRLRIEATPQAVRQESRQLLLVCRFANLRSREARQTSTARPTLALLCILHAAAGTRNRLRSAAANFGRAARGEYLCCLDQVRRRRTERLCTFAGHARWVIGVGRGRVDEGGVRRSVGVALWQVTCAVV